MLKFFKVLRFGLRDPDSRDVVLSTIVVLTFGTVFYRLVEKWSVLDSFYFSVVTLATVGFGDLTPETGVGKAFTAVYVLAGVGLIVLFANTYVTLVIKMRDEGGARGDG